MGFFSSADDATHFPAVSGRRIDGTDVELPRDLPADATLLVVAFRDDLDPVSDQWAALGERIASAHDGRVAVWETPVVDHKMKLLGGLATVGIRGELDDARERERTVVLYVDKTVFRKTLGIKTSEVVAFLVHRDGEIVWRGEDTIEMDEITGLEAAVADVLAAPRAAVTDDVAPEESADDADADAGALGPDERETAPRPPDEMTD